MNINDVKRILVVGAGQMGSQIAIQSALHGYEVTLNDLSSEETVQLVAAVTRKVGREPVILRKELPGFLVNRILRALAREAFTSSRRASRPSRTSTRRWSWG